MKCFILLFLLGAVCAKPVYDELENEADILALLESPHLQAYLTFAADDESDDEIKTELGKKLKEHLDSLLEKIKEAIDHGKTVKQDLLDKVKEIKEKLKDLHVGIGEKAKELLQKIRNHIRDWLQKLLDKLGLKETSERSYKRASDFIDSLHERYQNVLEKIREAVEKGKALRLDVLKEYVEVKKELLKAGEEASEKAKELIEEILSKASKQMREILDKFGFKTEEKKDLETRDLKEKINAFLRRVRDQINGGARLEVIRQKIEDSFFGKTEFGKKILDLLKEGGDKAREAIVKFIDNFLGGAEKRSLQEVWEKVKNFFKDINIQLKEKFLKFGEYVKEKFGNLVEKGKDAKEKLKIIAEQLKEHAKDLSKEVAEQAKEFLRPYKEDLGKLYDQVVASLNEIINKKDE